MKCMYGREESDGGHLADTLPNLPTFVAAQFLEMETEDKESIKIARKFLYFRQLLTFLSVFC